MVAQLQFYLVREIICIWSQILLEHLSKISCWEIKTERIVHTGYHLYANFFYIGKISHVCIFVHAFFPFPIYFEMLFLPCSCLKMSNTHVSNNECYKKLTCCIYFEKFIFFELLFMPDTESFIISYWEFAERARNHKGYLKNVVNDNGDIAFTSYGCTASVLPSTRDYLHLVTSIIRASIQDFMLGDQDSTNSAHSLQQVRNFFLCTKNFSSVHIFVCIVFIYHFEILFSPCCCHKGKDIQVLNNER